MTIQTDRRVWWIVLGLALGPAIGNGFARFGYGLILPAMRNDLIWTYTQAGWINTANALGYVMGALLALKLASHWGATRLFRWGMLMTTISLFGSSFAHEFALMLVWRIGAGIGAAWSFIAGGALVSAAFAETPRKNALAIAIYFGGAGAGILLSAIGIPAVFERYGASAWSDAWMILSVLSLIALTPAWWSGGQLPIPASFANSASEPLPWRKLVASLSGYLLFGAGYIVYMTFLVAWMKEQGFSTHSVSLTWAALGIGVMLSPFPWRGLLAAHSNGKPLAIACLTTGIGALLPLLVPNAIGLLLSAAIFGLSFFIAPTAVTSFSKKNFPQKQWGRVVALYTTMFALGQTLGPIGAGWLSDRVGNLNLGLASAALVLVLAGIVSSFQSKIAKE